MIRAAALADGTTILENAAKEPEIEDLANALNGMGGQVHGAGGDIVHIEGVKELHGVTHRIIPDRIEAGSFVIAAALTGGEVLVKRARAAHLDAFLIKLDEAGVTLSTDESGIRVRRNGSIKSVDVTTLPYPGFPTDLQAQLMVLMAVADGVSVMTETIFENRFMHAQELDRMGAQIKLEGNRAIVRGVHELSGAPVMASDLRASIALILAGLVAKGTTEGAAACSRWSSSWLSAATISRTCELACCANALASPAESARIESGKCSSATAARMACVASSSDMSGRRP